MIKDSWEEALPSDSIVYGNDDEAHLSYTAAELVISWRASADDELRVVARYDRHRDVLHTFPVDHLRTGPQFSTIQEIQFDTTRLRGWSWEDPVRESDRDGLLQIDGLPRGFGDIFRYGLGIRRDYRLFMNTIEEQTTCTAVRFGGGSEGLDGDVFHLSLARFEQFRLTVDRNKRRGTAVVGRINFAAAHNVFLDLFDIDEVKPTVGRNDVIVAITRELTGDKPLSEGELQLLLDQVTNEVPSVAKDEPARLKTLREDIELVTLETLIDSFRADLTGRHKKDEAHWQSFFESNVFALQQLFPAPVVLYDSRMHVAYSDDRGVGARIADFVLVNTVTRTAYVVEIKTPGCSLVGSVPYRGGADSAVYSVHPDLAGAVAQVQAQVESIRTELPNMLQKRVGADPIETYSVRAAVLAGTVDGLDLAQLASLHRFRDGLHDVEVLTFDEVLERLDGLHKVLADRGRSDDAD